jgi:hypothetical protein
MLAQTEAQFQTAVIEFARLSGWRVYHTHDSRHSEPGFPDLTMVRNGCLIFAELKADKGRLSPAQREWLADLETVAGWPAVEVYTWRPSQWSEIEEALR